MTNLRPDSTLHPLSFVSKVLPHPPPPSLSFPSLPSPIPLEKNRNIQKRPTGRYTSHTRETNYVHTTENLASSQDRLDNMEIQATAQVPPRSFCHHWEPLCFCTVLAYTSQHDVSHSEEITYATTQVWEVKVMEIQATTQVLFPHLFLPWLGTLCFCTVLAYTCQYGVSHSQGITHTTTQVWELKQSRKYCSQ